MGQLIFVVFSSSGGGGGVTTFEGRAGAVVGVAGDYTSTEITNLSGVVGATVTSALNTLNAGLGALDLQEAYDNGPTIVTAPGVPVEIDTLTVEDALISTSAGALTVRPIAGPTGGLTLATADNFGGAGDDTGNLTVVVGTADDVAGDLVITGGQSINGGVGGIINITGGVSNAAAGVGGLVTIAGGEGIDAAAGSGGSVDVVGGQGHGVGTGGGITVTGGPHDGLGGQGGTVGILGGSSVGALGGGVGISGGAGGVDAPNGFNGGDITATSGVGGNAVAGGVAGNGGVLTERSGNGGDATGAGATSGNGGDINIVAGAAGAIAGGAVSGIGGSVQVALDATFGGAAAVVGGWFLDPTTNRISLRTNGVVPTGSLKVHELDEAGEALQSPAQQGLLHFQTEQSAGIETTVGFRASKAGNYGLMARVYQQTIDNSGVYVVTHNLNCNAPLVAVYSGATYVATFAVTQNSLDQITVTAVVGAAGFLTVVGF